MNIGFGTLFHHTVEGITLTVNLQEMYLLLVINYLKNLSEKKS